MNILCKFGLHKYEWACYEEWRQNNQFLFKVPLKTARDARSWCRDIIDSIDRNCVKECVFCKKMKGPFLKQ